MNDKSINLTKARENITPIILRAGNILKKYFTSENFTSHTIRRG